MRAAEILTKIYSSSEVAECISRLRPKHLQEDILQHTFLEMFEKDEDFILDLNERGKLKSYITKVMYNTSIFTQSQFSKQQGRETPCDFSTYEVTKFLKTDTEEEERQENNEALQCAVSKLNWYKVEILQLYSTLGTYQKVSDKTGIPRSSIAKQIKQAKKEVKRLL